MAPARAGSPDESFFNDLSQQLDAEPSGGQTAASATRNAENAAKPKRIACVLCRKRKLKCDGQRPSCGTCKRLSHDCAYDEVRKKSGPKRGYVKALEARLQQVETMLKTQDVEPAQDTQDPATLFADRPRAPSMNNESPGGHVMNPDPQLFQTDNSSPKEFPAMNDGSMDTGSGSNPFSWEMIGLGLDEALPQQDVINELTQLYFDKVHPTFPMIHRPRFLAAMNLAPHMRPPICLRYIMWCFAASQTEKYSALQEHFYYRARKYAQQDEMKGFGEHTLTLAHCQAWVLIASYEFKCMYFPRAWLSVGRAVRLSQMMSLNKVDGVALDVKQCLPPPKDWTEREERRRTWWMCYNIDRYASIGTGWPMTIDERDIYTNLPVSDEAFDKSRQMDAPSMEEVLEGNGAASLSGTAGTIVMACLFGRNLTHLHRPTPDDNAHDINGEFWARHRNMDNLLLNLSLNLPDSLRLPGGLPDGNVVFTNMCIHTSAICLHQAAIFKAERNNLPSNIAQESKVRCVAAAAEIANIMRLCSHMDTSAMSPFMAFCLYVAARVFVQYLKNRPGDSQMNSSLEFLIRAMHVIKKRNPLTESFIVQLDLDLEGAGIMAGFQGKKREMSGWDPNKYKSSAEATMKAVGAIPASGIDSINCCPIYEIRDVPQSQVEPRTKDLETRGKDRRTYGDDFMKLPSSLNSPPPIDDTNPNATTGPPFIRAQHVNLEYSQWPSSSGFRATDGVTMQLPSRQRTPIGMSNPKSGEAQNRGETINCGFVSPEKDGSDMDTSPDPSGQEHSPAISGNSNSQQRGSSQSSYSSGYHATANMNQQQQQAQQPFSNNNDVNFQATAANNNNINNNDAGIPVSGVDSSFFAITSEEEFDDLAAQFYNPTTGVAEWDLGGGVMGAAGGTGLTPMAESTWNQMLDQPGWTGYGSGPR